MLNDNKADKNTQTDKKISACIKNAVNSYCEGNGSIRSVDFEEKANDGFSKFTAHIYYETFEQEIVYYPQALFARQFIDTQFCFENSEYKYSFYDIFNLFDINDFNLYYSDFYSAEDAEMAVIEILEATEKYYDYFEKAQSFEYLIQLEKNYETDMLNTAGSGWKEYEKDEFLLPENHIEFSAAGTGFKGRHMNKLRRKNKKGKLNLIYEKRFLKYIESGNQPERNYTVDLGAEHNKYRLIIDMVFFILSFFGIFAFIFLAAVYLYGMWAAFERINYNLVNCTVCALSFGGLLSVWLTKRIIRLILSKKYGKEIVTDYYNKDFNAIANKVVAVFLSVILAGWFYICLKAVLF